ncbi:site-specific DNA-methyltransferase [Neisseria dumasiana]|uniref:site-specific DNA-methyltransferase (adenine-specific) n=2 Tax=Neisseria dumasiana TaxID=1931275 RepID=A0A1X3DJ49_9NEIS|nr:site-specific DNA-methyltransferase [Neisseria dumasiana]
MIYIDPPYNTGSDSFIYPDKFSETREEYARRVGDKDDEGYLKRDGVFQGAWRKNSKESGHYHSNWLSMMLPRLHLAKTLLRDDGVIVLHIDEHEQSQLKLLCDEIFGEENNLGTIIWDKRNPKGDATAIATQHEYLIVFAKNKYEFVQKNELVRKKENAEIILAKAKNLIQNFGIGEQSRHEFKEWIRRQNFSGGELAYNQIDDEGNVFQPVSMAWPNNKKAPDDYFIPLIHPVTGKPCPVPMKGWRNPSNTMQDLLRKNLIVFGVDESIQPRRKYLLEENIYENVPSLLYFGGSDTALDMPFENPKPVTVAKKMIEVTCKDNDLILDFFSGSGTTAHAVMQLNAEDGGKRRYICVQLPEETDEKSEARKAGFDNIAEIAKERIRRAGRQIREQYPEKTVDTGFKVFKLAESHFKQWRPSENGSDGLEAQLAMFIDPVAEHAEPLNMAYELMLRLGLKLTCPLHGSDGVYWVEDEDTGKHTALLLTRADEALIDAVIAENPAKVVALDRLFDGNDSLKSNTVLQMRDAGIVFECV